MTFLIWDEKRTAESCNVHAEACPERSWRPIPPMAEESKGRISAIPETRTRAREHIWGCEGLGFFLCRLEMYVKVKLHASLHPAEAKCFSMLVGFVHVGVQRHCEGGGLPWVSCKIATCEWRWLSACQSGQSH